MTGTEEIHILMAEDNPGDARLTLEAFKEWKLKNKIHVVQDGEEAIDYLYKKSNYMDAQRPDLILLDLNMPKKNGREVLEIIKGDVNLRRIPTVILTTSQAEEDVFKTYDLHANSYIVKPIDIEKFIDVVKSLENYWFSIVKTPTVET